MARTTPRPSHVYRVECEQIEVTSLNPRPDPGWHYTDLAGHEHDHRRELLVETYDDPDDDPVYIDEDGEEWNAPTHLECRECGEWIEPGTLPPSPFAEYVPGVVRYYRDDVEISETEFKAAIPGVS